MSKEKITIKKDEIATQSFLRNELNTLEKTIDEKSTMKISKLRDEIITSLDKIIKELETAREDRIFAIAKDREQDQKIEDLDKRVAILETSCV